MNFGNCDLCLSALKRDISITKQFLEKYTWLTNVYISDYFTKELWKKVEKRWWMTLCVLSPPELATLLNSATWNVQCVWPLSLLAFRAAALGLALDRNPKTVEDAMVHRISSNTCSVHSKQTTGVESSNAGILQDEKPTIRSKITSGQHELLEHCYRRHVKPKKQHEILYLSKVVDAVGDFTKCSSVVDVGAGQGHLSRILHFGYGLNVTTVEASGCHAPKAQRYDAEVQKDVIKGHSKKVRKSTLPEKQKDSSDRTDDTAAEESRNPTHVTGWIDSDVSVEEFLSQVKRSRCEDNAGKEHSTLSSKATECTDQEKKQNRGLCAQSTYKDDSDATDCDTETFVITGLHACGDLTPTMMRVFVNCASASSLVSVACCYHKLTPDYDRNRHTGYPMSSFLRSYMDHNLSWETKEMACHFVDQYHDRLLDNLVALRSHVYRAALQEIIWDKDPRIEHGSIKLTLKKAHDLPFDQYAAKALSRLNLDTHISDKQLARAQERIQHCGEVVAFYTLRLTLAPVIEKLILLDRICFLAEQDINSTLVPIFDPQLSPRNFVLLALKHNYSM